MQRRWTTPLEVVAYVIAHVIGIVLVSISGALFMGRVFGYVARSYGYALVSAVVIAQSLVAMVVVLIIFLALRAAMSGGLPADTDRTAKPSD